MFTGIIEETGSVLSINGSESDTCEIRIACSKVLEGTKIGDSIAVNGVCLTVTTLSGSSVSGGSSDSSISSLSASSSSVSGASSDAFAHSSCFFTADVMAETLRRSNLGQLKTGSRVNLERAMISDGRFGGHIVSGHIDGCGKIESIKKEGIATWVKISCSDEILSLIVEKGSVAIDGISLTVAEVTEKDFSVSIIPHTGSETTLLSKKCGDKVNLENDIIGKYVQKLMGCNQSFKQKLTDEKILTWLSD